MKQLFIFIALFIAEIHSQVLCDPVIHSWHPHLYRCDKFILCFWGNEVELQCSPGLHFNRITSQCMEPPLANCVVEIQPNCQTPDDPNEIVFIASQTDCTRFFVCHNGIAIIRQCGKGLFFDIIDEWCTFAETVNCHPNVTNDPSSFRCPTQSGTSFHAHSTDCRRYFICINGISFPHQCAAGTLFDSITRQCTPANEAICLPGSSHMKSV